MNKTLIFHLAYVGNNITHVNVLKLMTTYNTNKWTINRNEFKKVVCAKYAWKRKAKST